jgi:hypothetical protein
MRIAGIDGDNIKMYLKKWGGRVWAGLIWSRVQYSGGLLHKYGKGPLGSVQRGGPAIPDDKDCTGSAGPFITTAVRFQTLFVALPLCLAPNL